MVSYWNSNFNNVQDLHALLKFLRVYQFDSLSYFNTHITKPLKSSEDKGLKNLKKLFRCVALRRTKESVKDQLELPPRYTNVQIVEFSLRERAIYAFLKRSLLFSFHSSGMEPDKYGKNGNILQFITQLRRFCDHSLDLLPQEVRALVETSGNQEDMARVLTSSLKVCDVCGTQVPSSDSKTIMLQTFQCGHNFCDACRPGNSSMAELCTLCFGLDLLGTPSSTPEYKPLKDEISVYEPSSKVQAMLQTLILEKSADPESKWYVQCLFLDDMKITRHSKNFFSVIFSSWTKMLDLVSIALRQQSLKYQRIDGRYSEKRRRCALEDFRTNAQCGILLASIGSAGVG